MGTLNTGKYSENEAYIYKKLESSGFSQAFICGALANIEHECNFNPAVTNSIGAYGLIQWLGGRKGNLYAKYGMSPTIDQQLEFMVYEFNSSESKAYNILKALPNTRDGAQKSGYNFARYYERCESEHYARRSTRAGEYWDHYVTGGAAASIQTTGTISSLTTGVDASVISNIPSYSSLATVNPYTSIIEKNLSRVTAEGFDYGYLIDMTYGGEFKFYIPEFNESAGSSWSTIDIPGRSVDILSYEKTSSRKITVSLELYAGVGLYTSGTDVVGAMHKDANFVKSLEYPNYDTTIARPPATVQLILGSAMNLVGVVSDVTVDHLKPLDSQNRAMYLKLSFTVTQTASNPPGQVNIQSGNYAMISTTDSGTMR